MKSLFKAKVLTILLAYTVLSTNYLKSWTLDDLKSYMGNSLNSLIEYGKIAGNSALKFKTTTIELVSTYLGSKWNSKLSLVSSHLRKAYTIPTRLLKPSIGIISSSKDKVSQLVKIAKDSKPNSTDITQEAECLNRFSNSINDIASSLKETSTFPKWMDKLSEKNTTVSKFIEKLSTGISDIYNKVTKNGITNSKPKLNMISDIYNKVAENGITNSIESDTINGLVNQEAAAYNSFKECIKNIPNEQLSILSKTIKTMRFDTYSDLIKIKFETIKFLFQNFLETVAPDNDLMQSTITWIIVLVGIPATTYGIYKLVKMIIKTIPTISKFSLSLAKGIANKGLETTKYTVNKSYELSKYIAVKIVSLLTNTTKALIIDTPRKIITGIISFLGKNPFFTSTILNGLLIYGIMVNYEN